VGGKSSYLSFKNRTGSAWDAREARRVMFVTRQYLETIKRQSVR